MELGVRDDDVYGLINRLCENLLKRHYQIQEYLYEPEHNNAKYLKKLKAKAYEILLKKSKYDFANNYKSCDPIVELLKHAFILKVGTSCNSKATELEKYLNEFIDKGLKPNSITYCTLQFLNELKSIDIEDDSSLDIFHYAESHPMLPEIISVKGEVPPFQIYPKEFLCLPKKFESALKQKHDIIRYNLDEPGSNLPLLSQFLPISNYKKSDNIRMSDIPKHTIKLLNGMNVALNFFSSELKGINKLDEAGKSNNVINTDSVTSSYYRNQLQNFTDKNITNKKNEIEIYEIENKELPNLDKLWEEMDKTAPFSNHRTWETLGSSNSPKELPFGSESIEATLHLINVAYDSFLSKKHKQDNKIIEVSAKELIKNIKLLLIGIESSTFIYKVSIGFQLKKNIVIHSISAETLENLTYEIVRWGTSLKNLSTLIVTNQETGKLQIEGLIFKALCNSIKEFLLFYNAAILRMSISQDDTVGLLKFIDKIRPLGNLINKIAKLCHCDNRTLSSLGEGIGILTHIYYEVTKVTEQNVALVFYSILKNCCEVYFQFLQRWIFEGECTDLFEEFMIKVKPQYLRTHGHRFWTRAFSINQKSVPGFLSELTDSILQCGKTIALLRICNPQNPLCRVSESNQPQIRVCLSVGMLREQAKFYENYVTQGEINQGGHVSLSSAIQEEKEIEKKRAQLVIEAQQDTLLRLKKEREDELKRILKEKSDLLEQLKDQAEEVAHRKEQNRNAELLADKLLLENILKQEEEAKNIERLEKENTIKYYTELAEEAERRRIHSNWRIRRMKLFDERILAISDLRHEFVTTPDKSSMVVEIDNSEIKKYLRKVEVSTKKNVDDIKVLIQNEISENNTRKDKNFVVSVPIPKNTRIIEIPSEDENSNPTSEKVNESSSKSKFINVIVEENQNVNIQNKEIEKIAVEQFQTKPIRPNILDIPETNILKYSKNFDILDSLKNDKNTNIEKRAFKFLNLTEMDNMTEAQLNKLKILQSEYGISPNNNKSIGTILTIDTSKKQSNILEIEKNRLKNTNHLTHLNWNDNEITKYHNVDEDNANKPKSEIQINRLRNTQHLTHLNWNEPTISEILHKKPLTEAQINKNKIMSHFYNRMEEFENITKSENLNDCQKNRNRNMAHTMDQLDFDINRFSDREQHKETPMSTTTDPFTISTCSISLQVPSCENTPFSEITNQSDMIFDKFSNNISSEDISQSRDSKYFQISPAYPNFIGLNSVPNTPSVERLCNISSIETQLTAADVEMIDTTSLQVYLEKSVIIPLTAQNRLVNNAIIKYLLTEHNMLSHIHSLRSYFFLLNGEFAKTLMQSLFTLLYKITIPAELFNSSTLTSVLEKALVNSLSSTYTNSELLSLSAKNVPTALQTSDPEILSCLSLNYKVSWPLNIIFNDIVMQQYRRVFKFLLMVSRVLWVLQEDFQILKIERKASITKNHHKLQLYRHSMMQFMNALHSYLTCSVLHASWSEFEKKLENATTLDEIYDTHVSYIKKILSRCMLNSRGDKMRMCLCNIFKVVLKFHNRIRAQSWNESKLASSNYENLERMYVAFCEQRAYLAHVAEKLANTGYQPHLLHFLHALNINYRYNLNS